MKQIHHDFNRSGGGFTQQCIYFNKEELREAEDMQRLYLNESLSLVAGKLEENVHDK